eukprot:366163-Chlamydomonas_euryale.AAC.4
MSEREKRRKGSEGHSHGARTDAPIQSTSSTCARGWTCALGWTCTHGWIGAQSSNAHVDGQVCNPAMRTWMDRCRAVHAHVDGQVHTPRPNAAARALCAISPPPPKKTSCSAAYSSPLKLNHLSAPACQSALITFCIICQPCGTISLFLPSALWHLPSLPHSASSALPNHAPGHLPLVETFPAWHSSNVPRADGFLRSGHDGRAIWLEGDVADRVLVLPDDRRVRPHFVGKLPQARGAVVAHADNLHTCGWAIRIHAFISQGRMIGVCGLRRALVVLVAVARSSVACPSLVCFSIAHSSVAPSSVAWLSMTCRNAIQIQCRNAMQSNPYPCRRPASWKSRDGTGCQLPCRQPQTD